MAGNEKKMCVLHPDVPAASACNFCSQPICRACIRDNGLFCSPECKAQSAARAAARTHAEAAAPRQVDQAFEKTKSHLRLGLMVMGAIVVVTVGQLVWKYLLDATGKVAWRWECKAPGGGLKLVAADPQQTIVRTPQGIVLLDSASGRVLKEFSVQDEPVPATGDGAGAAGLGADQPPVRLLPGGRLLFVSPHRVFCYTLDGRQAWEILLPGLDLKALATSADGKTLALVQAPPRPSLPARVKVTTVEERIAVAAAWKEYRQKCDALHDTIQVYDMTSGAARWTRELAAGQCVSGLLADHAQIVASWPLQGADEEADAELQAWSADAGKPLWTLKAGDYLEWGPAWAGDRVLFCADNLFRGIGPDGQEAYNFHAPRNPAAKVGSGLILITGAADCLYAYDLASGKHRWTLKIDTAFLAGVVLTDPVLYLRGSRQEVCATPVGPRRPAGQNSPDAAEDAKAAAAAIALPSDAPAVGSKIVDVAYLVAADPATGNVKWLTRAVHGTIFADAERVLSVADTLAMNLPDLSASGGKGETLFQEFDLKSGKIQCERRDPIGLTTPLSAGNRVVGIIYDRNTVMPPRPRNSTMPYQPPACLGVGALKAR